MNVLWVLRALLCGQKAQMVVSVRHLRRTARVHAIDLRCDLISGPNHAWQTKASNVLL